MRKLIYSLVLIFPFMSFGLAAYAWYIAPVYKEFGGASCLQDARRDGVHTDYMWGLIRWVQWKNTVVCGIDPPVLDGGNQDYHYGSDHLKQPKPIPLPGEWQRSHAIARLKNGKTRKLPYIAITLPNGWHARLGWRWDDLDDFYIFSFVIFKKISPNLERINFLRSHNFC